MKAFLSAILLLTVCFSTQASEYDYNLGGEKSFQVEPEVYMYDTYAEAYIYNDSYRPISCSGQIQGVTRNGAYVYAYANNIIIQAGMYISLYIYTSNYNPFRNVFHNMFCYFL